MVYSPKETLSLRNIAAGVIAEDGVNCEKAKEVGDSKVAGKDVHEHSFQKKDEVKTLACKTFVHFKDGSIQIDPQMLFQRLNVLAASMTTGFIFFNMKCLATLQRCLTLLCH